MDGPKLEISAKAVAKDQQQPLSATYKQVPESDAEDEAISRSKGLIKLAIRSPEVDGADEKMLPESELKIADNSAINSVDVKFISNEKQNGDAKVDIGELKGGFVGMGKEELMKYANDPFWVRLRWFLFITFWLLWAAMLVGAILIIIAAPKCAPPEPRTWWEQGPITELEADTPKEQLLQLKDTGVKGVIIPYPHDTYKPLNESKDFVALLKWAKDSDVNVVVELQPGSSSQWFTESEAKDEMYDDFYIWRGQKTNARGRSEPPNNWVSKRNRSAWIFSEPRNEYYYSPEDSPHLNFRNPKVIEKFSAVLTSVLEAGAKGIRLRGAPNLLVDPSYKNESVGPDVGTIYPDYRFFTHTNTEYVDGLGPLLKTWRDIVKNKTVNGPFMLEEELGKLESFRVNNSLVVDLPRHSKLFNSNKPLTMPNIYYDLEASFAFLETYWPLWEHKSKSLPSDVLDIVTMLLPGVTLIDKEATVAPELLTLRNSPSIMFGSCNRYKVANDAVLAFIRVASGNPGYLVALNPTPYRIVVDFPKDIPVISEEVTVQFLSQNYNETDIQIKFSTNAHTFPLSPQSAVILTYVPKA